jgi:hypothetical protein
MHRARQHTVKRSLWNGVARDWIALPIATPTTETDPSALPSPSLPPPCPGLRGQPAGLDSPKVLLIDLRLGVGLRRGSRRIELYDASNTSHRLGSPMRRGTAGMDETTHISQYSGSTPTYPAHRRHHRFQRNNPTVIGQVKHLARAVPA